MVERVESPQAFRELHALLLEYERSLAPDLRHGAKPSLHDVEQTYAGANAAFVVRLGEVYAGCVGVRVIDPATAVLQRLYVRPQHRGHGAARALVAASIEFARGHGCARIVLDTQAERLEAAAALYRSLGFTDCPPYAAVDYENPTFMELRLR